MRIEVRTPAEVSEVSRALQLRNRQRLEDRQADGWAEQDATRLAKRARALVGNLASRKVKTDPWRGAVPEFPPDADVRAPRLGKRFKIAGGYFKFATSGRLQVQTADKGTSIDVAMRTPFVSYTHIVLPIGSGRLLLVITDYNGNGYAVAISRTEIKVKTSIPSQLSTILRRFLVRPEGEFFSYFESALLDFFPPENPDFPPVWVWTPLLRSYGYGHLVNRDANGQTPGWGWTPIVFSFLRNYRGEFHKVNGDTAMIYNAFSYAYIRNKYIPDDAPQYFVTTDVQFPGVNEDTTEAYYYFKAPLSQSGGVVSGGTVGPGGFRRLPKGPAGFRTEGTESNPGVVLLPNRGEYTREVVAFDNSQFSGAALTQREFETSNQPDLAGYEVPVSAWDWDRPIACWIELTRLGFTPADLMLSESEAQALAEADPAEAAFKF